VITSAGAGSAKVKLILSNGQDYPGQGELKFSDVTVDQTTNSVTLRALFPNPHNILLPGMFVRAQLVQGVIRQGILAPQIAVTHDPKGEATAMVVGAGDKVESRNLKLGGAYGDKWLVTDGLKAGDKLIVEGGMKAQAGAVVKPVPAQAAAPATPAGAQGAAG